MSISWICTVKFSPSFDIVNDVNIKISFVHKILNTEYSRLNLPAHFYLYDYFWGRLKPNGIRHHFPVSQFVKQKFISFDQKTKKSKVESNHKTIYHVCLFMFSWRINSSWRTWNSQRKAFNKIALRFFLLPFFLFLAYLWVLIVCDQGVLMVSLSAWLCSQINSIIYTTFQLNRSNYMF